MPTTLDVSYYNTFLLKQVTESENSTPVWPKGFPYNANIEISEAIGPFPGEASIGNTYIVFT